MSMHEQRFLPRGELRLHTEMLSPTNATYERGAAAKDIAGMNIPKYLRGILNDRTALFDDLIVGKGLVRVLVPKSPYGYGALMVVATDDRLFDPRNDAFLTNEVGVVPTKTIYDLDPAVQRNYFKQILSAMKAMESESLPGENKEQDSPQVIAAENNIYKVSDGDHRTSRSIALPHAQVFRAGSWIDTGIPPDVPYELKLEQRITRPGIGLEKFVNALSERMRAGLGDTGEQLQFSQRGVEPYGWAIVTSIHKDSSVGEQADALQEIMALNQSEYADMARDAVSKTNLKDKNKRRIIPQPSTRSYLYFDREGFLNCVVSPEIFSAAGIFEAALVGMNRDPKHPNPYKNGEVEEFRDKVVKRMEGL